MEHHAQIAVHEVTQIGSARRHAVRMAEAIDLSATTISNIAIVVTELATNLQRYGREGSLLFRCSQADGFEAISIDRGPGMDVQRCLQDGFSTGGSSGTGLGAVRRLANSFDIYSTADKGSVVWAKLTNGNPSATTTSGMVESTVERIQYAGISLPYPGETACGDAWSISVDPDAFRIVVADGLGHGHDAALASAQVIDQFRTTPTPWHPKSFLERTHTALAGSRGAAVAAGHIPHTSNELCFAGIGNISATIIGNDSSKGLMSHNGTLGGRIRSVQSVQYEWPRDALLVMHSDGLITRWSETAYPGILTRHPAILAAVLVRDYSRGRDDVTVVVVRRR